MKLSDMLIPAIVLTVFLIALFKKTDIFGSFSSGAKENLEVGVGILPSLITLMLAVEMFKASGAMNAVTELIRPLTSLIGFPAECVPLAIMRPISGSGAMSVFESIIERNNPDGFIGRVASVLLGSTETTFYTAAVYFGATKIKNTRHAIPSALAGDLTAFLLSALTVRLFFGG